MFLAAGALALGIAGAGVKPVIWRCFDEVYDLAVYHGKAVAATSGGVLYESSPHQWRPLGVGGPAAIRRFLGSGSSLRVADRAGQVFDYRAPEWIRTGEFVRTDTETLPSPTVEFNGRRLRSPWGGKFLVDDRGATILSRDPAEGDYALLALGNGLIAGTRSGIYSYSEGRWSLDKTPWSVPVQRPQGIAFDAKGCLVGGLGGVYVRQSLAWSQASSQPVRQVLKSGENVWVLYGSGSVDKFDITHNQVVFDAVNEGAKRPWTSCLASVDGDVLFGGQGGWIERGKKGVSEHYFHEIDNDVVMAMAGRGAVRWIGTQKAGLLRFSGASVKQWNPGNGLTDTWVTALLHTPEGLYIATAGGGLFLLKGDAVSPVDSPTQRPRQLALYKGKLVVGAMDGAWIRDGRGWRELPTQGEETTSIVCGSKLVICTASGVYFLS